MSGIRAQVAVHDPAHCPVAAVAGAAGASVSRISRAAPTGASSAKAEELTVDRELFESDRLQETFASDSERVYRLQRDNGVTCICDAVESLGVPVSSVEIDDGTLYITVNATDDAELRTVLSTLTERYEDVTLQRITTAGENADLVTLDRAALTDRQREVLETAHRMGYFEHPMRANAGEVADELGISRTTLREHLAAAQTKLLDALLD